MRTWDVGFGRDGRNDICGVLTEDLAWHGIASLVGLILDGNGLRPEWVCRQDMYDKTG